MWDVFISHAWEDKASVAKPLADALVAADVSVWYDELALKLGDGLRRSIDKGIAGSRFGVVILSPDFFRKNWPQRELDGLATREVSGGKTILPILHRLTQKQLEEFSPTLADKISVSTDKGLGKVVDAILSVVRPEALALGASSFAPSSFDPAAALRASRASFGLREVHAEPAGTVLRSGDLGYSASFFFRPDWEVRGPVSVDGYGTAQMLREYIEKMQSERARRLNRGVDVTYVDSELGRARRMIDAMMARGVDRVDYLDENLKELPSSLRRIACEILNLDDPDTSSATKGAITQRMLDDARSRYRSDGRKPSPLIDQLAERLGLH